MTANSFAKQIFSLESALQAERPRLTRLCAYLTGSVEAADDLAQETMIEAWRNAHKLVEPEGFNRWLSAIARNVCYRWGRRQGRRLKWRASTPTEIDSVDFLEQIAAPKFNLAHNLEQNELAELLEQAMALLPPKTRQILILRFLLQRPNIEVAQELGLSENAVAVRIHRGKLALREVLSTELRHQILEYGIVLPEVNGWQQTRIWCPRCGMAHLEGKFDETEFILHCLNCASHPDDHIAQWDVPSDLLQGLKAYKPALSRVLNWGYEYYRQGLETSELSCYSCNRLAQLQRRLPPGTPGGQQGKRGLHMFCPKCRPMNFGTLEHFTLSMPEVQTFWKQNPRMRTIPVQEINVQGQAGLKVSFESLISPAQLDVLLDRHSYKTIAIIEKG